MAGQIPFTKLSRMSRAKALEYSLISSYKYGYRNREDITNLPPSVLIVGSQNVLHNASNRIQIRQGYALDGVTSTVAAAILGSFDFNTFSGAERHLRSGFQTSSNNGKLQYRFVDSFGAVTWTDLMTSLTNTLIRFTTFWDTTEEKIVALFVDGTPNIYKWNGAIGTLASATSSTITLQGSQTWAQLGFNQTGEKNILIGNTTATYSGGETTSTLTGVSVDFSATAVGTPIAQDVVTIANSAMTTIPATFKNHLIGTKANAVYVGADDDVRVFQSKVNTYTDFSQSTPRKVGEGNVYYFDDVPTAIVIQEDKVYISAGQNFWYTLTSTLSSDLLNEVIDVTPLKTTAQQSALTQEMVSHRKNDVVMITHEPTMDTLGRVEQILGTPNTMNISDPIKNDFDSYDFSQGSIFYFRYFIYVAVPKEGLVRIFNLTTNTWEAPQNLPISRFYIVEGELYGHSYNTSESYKLFTGYADRVYAGFPGFPIDAIARFSYEQFGSRSALKHANGLYVEGYITPNTTLTCTITYELDGCASTQTFEVDGSDTQIVCIPMEAGSLGKVSLGKQKLGGAGTVSLTNLPPKFRVEKTFPNRNFFECSISFEVLGVDNRFELLAFGLNNGFASEAPTYIRQ